MVAGVSALLVFLGAVDSAASAIPRPSGASGRLPAAFVACALLLGLVVWLVARYAKQRLTIARALHICIGFCGVLLAAAWILRPGG